MCFILFIRQKHFEEKILLKFIGKECDEDLKKVSENDAKRDNLEDNKKDRKSKNSGWQDMSAFWFLIRQMIYCPLVLKDDLAEEAVGNRKENSVKIINQLFYETILP